ncbi:MAG TPA: hypothetical protein VK281_11110 [Xanthobacteraceae bacterium]|nr:hypothetical protein [Xanthobacteraceae bacterium]
MRVVRAPEDPQIDSAGFWTYTLACSQCRNIERAIIDPLDDHLC